MRLVTADEMRALDRATIEGGHADGATLMERAGAGVAAAMERRYGPLLALRVLVLCGSGNNGGDGFVAARHLLARGALPAVALLAARARVRGDAALHLARAEDAGVRVTECPDADALERLRASRDGWDYALDAVLGTGARGDPEGMAAAAVETLRALDDAGTPVVAVDQPTGVSSDSGAIARRAVRADLTVTFGAPKRGQLLYPGRAFVGALEVVDIGLVAEAPGAPGRVSLATLDALAPLLPLRDPRAHKGSAGRVLVVGGSPGLTGSVALAARAATRSGAGYVQAAVPAPLHDVLETKLTEEMTIPSAATVDGTLSEAALPALLERAAAAHVVALGSGLSRAEEPLALARALVARSPRPLVLDADGLNAFAGRAEALAAAAAPRVLTPHLGELERLTGEPPDAIEDRRIDAAIEAATRLRSVVVLKGAPTVVAAPDGRASVNPTGNPGMATAGAGDVLTGVIAALAAQGLAPYDAARLGVFAHGLAGDRAAARLSIPGLSASDLVEALPEAWRALEGERDAHLERRGARARNHVRPAPGGAGRAE